MYSFYQPIWDPNLPEDVSQEYMEPRELRGKQFEEFLDICFNYASFFSLSKVPWTFCVDKSLERDLAQYKTRTITTPKWFCYDLPDRTLEISIYQATMETKSIFLKHYSRLFLFAENGIQVTVAQTLENLCFYTREKLFMGTVTHEFMCYVYPPDESFERELSRFGRWVYKKDSIKDQIRFADYM